MAFPTDGFVGSEVENLDESLELADRVEKSAPRNALRLAVLFEGGLLVVAVVVAWLFHIPLLESAPVDRWQIAWGLAATLPMLALYWSLNRSRRRSLKEIKSTVDWLAKELFPTGSLVAIAIVSVLAGVGEEALFRGVAQPLIGSWIAPWVGEPASVAVGLVVASLLFGLAHYVTTLYFVLATLIGFYLGGLAIAFDGITVPIIAHAAYDFVVLTHVVRGEG